MTQAHCHGCGDTITDQNDSEAHIIPNALGGRLAPKGLICRTCNSVLDKVADNALVEAFGAWPTLLDLPRQRGKNPPKTIDSDQGYKVRIDADGSLTRTDVQYEVTPLAEGYGVELSAGNIKTVRQLINRASKQFPQLDPVQAEAHARKVGMPPSDQIRMGIDAHPKAVFGGAVSAFWLFILAKTGHPIMSWARLLDCIKKMQMNGGTFRYFVDGLPGLCGPNIEIGHKIVVRGVPATGELICCLEILGVLKIGGVFAKGPIGTEIEHIYAYDLDQRTERSGEFSIDPDVFDVQNWSSIGLGISDAETLKMRITEALKPLADYYYKKGSEQSTDN